jgi:uncharacterized phage protein (TIGR01671 family)
MRSLKFRVWDKQQKKYHTDSDWGISLDGKSIIGFSSHDRWAEDRGYKIKLDELIIEQFTGLFDLNGTEIFEGDIVKISTKGDDEPLFAKILINNNAQWVVAKNRHNNNNYNKLINKGYAKCMIVNGNIHENPDLLDK